MGNEISFFPATTAVDHQPNSVVAIARSAVPSTTATATTAGMARHLMTAAGCPRPGQSVRPAISGNQFDTFWEDLPLDMKGGVTKACERATLRTMRQVNKEMNGLVSEQVTSLSIGNKSDMAAAIQRFPNIDTLKLTKTVQLSPGDLDVLRTCKNLTSLSIADASNVGDEMWRLLGGLHLQKVSLEMASIDDDGFGHLVAGAQLRELRIVPFPHTEISFDGITQLKVCRHLHTLTLPRADVSTLEMLRTLTDLTHLRLTAAHDIDEHAWHLLRELPLQSVFVDGDRMGDVALGHLAALGHLRELGLPSSKITDNGIAQLEACPQLHSLDLTAARSLTDAAFTKLSKVTTLTSLHLARCGEIQGGTNLANFLRQQPALHTLDLQKTPRFPINEDLFRAIGRLPRLKQLSMNVPYDTSSDYLAHLQPLLQLESLILSDSDDLEGNALAFLRGKSKLKTLELAESPSIDDAALAHLCELPALAALDLRNAYLISDAGLSRLGNLPALRNLKLTSDARTEKRYLVPASHMRSGAPGLTKEGTEALQKRLPALIIEME